MPTIYYFGISKTIVQKNDYSYITQPDKKKPDSVSESGLW
jgi:hypothetical protein